MYAAEDRRLSDAVARHVLRVVGGEVDEVVVRLR
jgi:hypothetical protein